MWLIAASAGGIRAVSTILRAVPPDFQAAFVVVQHRTPGRDENLNAILRRSSGLPVASAIEGQAIESGHVYVAQARSHLTVTDARAFHYCNGTRIRFLRSSANPLFESAAAVFDGRVVAVVLTGGGHDATDGVQGVKARGGHVIAQDQASSEHWSMPRSAIASGVVDYVLPIDAIFPALDDIVHARPVAAAATQAPPR